MSKFESPFFFQYVVPKILENLQTLVCRQKNLHVHAIENINSPKNMPEMVKNDAPVENE